MTSVDFYTSLVLEAQSWMPTPLPQEEFKCSDRGVPETIERILALSLQLEMPVGAFLGSALKRDLALPPTAIKLLRQNIKDEAKHERQFQLAAETYPIRQSVQEEARFIAADWLSHPDHTLLKAKELETGVFLESQALLRFFGGQALDRMAADISADEWRHVQTNWSVAEELGLQSSNSLDSLCTETFGWIVSGLTFPQFNADFWLRQSKLMREVGESEEMSSLFVWTPRIEFFECSSEHVSAYG